MFDSPPQNLPVEPPIQSPAPPPQPAGSRPVPPAPSQTLSTSGKREPEDIFAGIEHGGGSGGPAMQSGLEDAPRKSPAKLIAVITGIVLLVIAIVGILYYVFVIRPAAQEAAAPIPQQPVAQQPASTATQVVEQPPVVDQQTAPVQQTATQPTTLPPTNVPPPQNVAPTPSTQPDTASTTSSTPPISVAGAAPVEGGDIDHDNLTDTEEAMFGTAPENADTDGDGHSDGAEVLALFSPTQKGAGITASPAIRIGSWHGATFLIPSLWTVAPNDVDPDSATISTQTAELFSLHVTPNPSHQNLADWVAGQFHTSGLRTFKTKNGLDAVQTPDGFTTYVAVGDTIWAVNYNLNSSSKIDFRTTFAMLVTSIRPSAK